MAAGWSIVALAFCLSLVLTPVVRAWLRHRGLVDQPGLRRSHRTPTPRGGGLALVAALSLALIWAAGFDGLVAVVLVLALAAIGWLDDIHDLPVRWRLAGQLTVALLMLGYAGPIAGVALGGRILEWPWLWSALAVIAVVWLVNLHNFMDGSDGLAAMQGTWTGLVLGTLLYAGGAPVAGAAGLALAGACLGFAVWNRPPARIFMGDVGSVSLGGVVGLLALVGAASGQVSIWLSLIVCALFVVDATATLLGRAAGGARWYTAHREHAYQRLIRAGWSHGRVLVLYTMVNVVLVLPVLLLALRYPAWEAVFAGGLALVLTAAWYLVRTVTEKENTAP